MVAQSEGVCRSLLKESAVPELDGIRAISCIWVSFSHALFLWQVSAPELFQKIYALWWPISVPFNGDMGVDFFLLLSGYLIGGSVFTEIKQTGSFQMAPFFARRLFRIAPVFYVAVALAICLQGFAACQVALVKKLFFVENMSVNLQEEGQCAPQSWSVGLEMQLYLVTPPLISLSFYVGRLFRTTAARVVAVVCFCSWAACCLSRFLALSSVRAMDGSIWYTGTPYRCAPYVIGVLVSVLRAENLEKCDGRPEEPQPSKALPGLFQKFTTLMAWVLIFDCMYFGGGGPLLGFESPMEKWPFGAQMAELHFVLGRPLTGVAAGYLLLQVLNSSAPRLRKALMAPLWRPLARLSYSAYMMQVVNFAFAEWLLAPVGINNNSFAKTLSAFSDVSMVALLYAWAFMYTLFAFTLAFICYMFVEKPGMAFGHRLGASLKRTVHDEVLAKPLV
eukprot:TRINITY_DN22809_c0_g1_i1.p1 TRINITY_DN22809_c0_g1~~TRINITY_DN22809_c0_g1_i1.p1  ORF type:complete len:448 (-),score=50.76 TRINITY_DN22809_c0_g1_i1:107-1450(-)